MNRPAALLAVLAVWGCTPATIPRRTASPIPGRPAPDAVSVPPPSREKEGGLQQPLILAPLENINDFDLLANGGFDPGWRVGFDTAWVVQLPPAPQGRWKKAYLGAKLGRAKFEPVPGRPSWEKRRVRGEVDIAVAPEPLWPHSRRALLARADQIPLEGDPDNAAAGVGESRWFWTEVPVKHVSFDRPNFVLLFSPSQSLKSPDRSPVLAAGPRKGMAQGVNTWLSSGRKGQPPMGVNEAFKTSVKTYAPAVALKLIPENDLAVAVSWTEFPERGQVVTGPFQVGVSVQGTDVSRAWIESSTDTFKWSATGAAVLTPPYSFTVDPASLPEGEVLLRVTATDAWENRGVTEPRRVIVPQQKK